MMACRLDVEGVSRYISAGDKAVYESLLNLSQG